MKPGGSAGVAVATVDGSEVVVPSVAMTWKSQGRPVLRPETVAYATEHAGDAPHCSAIYGGVAGGLTDEADKFIRSVMTDMMAGHQQVLAG